MDFDRKTILAFVLIGLVLLITSTDWYQRLAFPDRETRTEVSKPDSVYTESSAESSFLSTESRAAGAVEKAQQTIQDEEGEEKGAGQPVTPVTASSEPGVPVFVETDLYRAVLNTRGAVLTEWVLKKYVRFDSNEVQLVAPGGEGNLAVVVPTFADTIDTGVFRFEVDRGNIRLDESRRQGELTFRASLGPGLEVEKKFIFYNDRYSIDLQVRLVGFGSIVRDFKYLVKWEAGLLPTERVIDQDMRYAKAYVLTKGDLISQDAEKTKPVSHPALWAAARTKYFTVAIIPRNQEAMGVDITGRTEELYDGQLLKAYSFALEMPLVRKEAVVDSFTVYLGPLDYKILKGYGIGLERMMNFGWKVIRPISVFVLLSLQVLHKFIPNYGVVLILFSLLVKIVVYPLTKKSYQSMKRMQDLQPRLVELKEKYAKDPQRLNRETMKLYKEHGVNPLGGCLPTLLQLPLLYALFIVFQSTIELRGAGFFGWIRDLSAPDTVFQLPFSLPFYGNNVNVLPVVMGVTMLWQQKMTIQDPKQKAMVYLMPILFVFLFNNFPSGLTLYYTVFNVFTIIQQKMIKNTETAELAKGKKEVPGKRGAKPVGMKVKR
jgi:YidC/Oxa1 family membrane protein insertase